MVDKVIGGVLGGVLGGGDSGGQQVSKDPWGPAQKPLQDTLTDAQRLQAFYQQNPWNSIQQTGYQNMATDLDAFRGQKNGIAQFANRLMGTNYQRGAPQQGAAQAPQGLLSQAPQQGIFSIPQGQQYGLLDFAQLNPYTAADGIKEPEKPAETAPEVDPANRPYNWRDEFDRLLRGQINYTGSGA